MAADYTDGGGWAKLDTTAALELADVIAAFPPNATQRYTRMLLVLYASTAKDGTVSTGYRTLAEKAGVTVMAARHFIAWMDSHKVLVSEGAKKTRAGQFTVRRWAWVKEGGCVYHPTHPVSLSQRNSTHPRVVSPGQIDTYQSSTELSEGACGSAAAAPPPENIQMFGPNVPGLGMRTD